MSQPGGRGAEPSRPGGDDSFWQRPADGHGGIDDPSPAAAPTQPVRPSQPTQPVQPVPPVQSVPQAWPAQPPVQQPPVQPLPPMQQPQARPVPPSVPQQAPGVDPYRMPPPAGPAQNPWSVQNPGQQQGGYANAGYNNGGYQNPGYQNGPFGQVQVSRRSGRGGCLWMLVMSVLATLALNYCSSQITTIPFPTTEDTSTPHTVTILVTTSTPSDVNWSVGAQAGFLEVRTNWSRTYQTTGRKVVSVSVQPNTPGTGAEVGCEIQVDGKTIDTSTSPDNLASCTGTTQ